MDFKKEAARVANTLIKNNSSVGLGDGSAIRILAAYLLEGVRQGLDIRLYTSSVQTERLLKDAGITVHDISIIDKLDQYFDGCDQVDEQLNVVKSGSGIHTQEKLLAVMADQFIILAEESKFVPFPDPKFPLVLEVLPQSAKFVIREMKTICPGAGVAIRYNQDDEQSPVITRNGNYLMNCWFPEWPDAAFIQSRTKQITGVVEISLFYKIADEAIIAGKAGIFRHQRKNGLVSITDCYPLEAK
jgi:ribose 5-phosphate isomerase A